MKQLPSTLRGLLIGAASVGLILTAYIALHSFNDPEPEAEDCSNGIDDDGDGFPDCMDIDCIGERACNTSPDGDSDADQDGDATTFDGDLETDGDTNDADIEAVSDAEADGELQVDGDPTDTGADADSTERYCSSDSGVCVWDCTMAEDCVIALDMLNCCGGHPHAGEDPEELIVCPSAVHRDRIDEDPCVIPWDPDAPIPDPPAMCAPYCDGLVCGACRPPSGATCRDSMCVGFASGGCATDRDCPGSSRCVDPDGDGMGTCSSGEHLCDSDEECLEARSECDGCRCMDTDVDGFRECSCWGCPTGDCSADTQCDDHEFCIGETCVFAGEDACRMGMWDCIDGEVCQPSEGNPSRGTCIPIEVDGGVDGGAGDGGT